MMPTRESSRRSFRWQLSLRMLLLLMALVGVSLAVYRWPWVEMTQHDVMVNEIVPVPPDPSYFNPENPFETSDPKGNDRYRYEPKLLYSYERRTTYQRSWRAQPVKHGVQQTWRDGRLLHEAHFYEGELNGRRRAYDRKGNLVLEATYRAGSLHGPYRAGDGQRWSWQGDYHSGRLDGDWKGMIVRRVRAEPSPPDFERYFAIDGTPLQELTGFPLPDDPVVLEAHWKLGQRQGTWKWKTVSGELFNTAEYDGDNLVRWNGELAVEQFLTWLKNSHADDGACTQFFEKATAGQWRQGRQAKLFEYPNDYICFQLTDAKQAESTLYLFGNFAQNQNWAIPQHRALAPAMCELAVLNGYGFDIRYGQLWLVPSADPEPVFVDPTGISNVSFAPGTSQERDWNAKVDVMSCNFFVEECLAQLFEGSSLTYDDTAVRLKKPEIKQTNFKFLFTCRRCDALALVLYLTGCKCERRGDTLVIVPCVGRTREQKRGQPLLHPDFEPVRRRALRWVF
jgi:hypothetical protein